MPSSARRRPMASASCSRAQPSELRLAMTCSARLLLADRERAVRDLDQDPTVLDDHWVDLERKLGRRIDRFAAREVEPRQVQGTGQGARRQEPFVELEVFVTADALRRGELAALIDDEDLVGPIDDDDLHLAV